MRFIHLALAGRELAEAHRKMAEDRAAEAEAKAARIQRQLDDIISTPGAAEVKRLRDERDHYRASYHERLAEVRALSQRANELERERFEAAAAAEALRAAARTALEELAKQSGDKCDECGERYATRFNVDQVGWNGEDGLSVAHACDACQPEWEEAPFAAAMRALEAALGRGEPR